LIKDAKNIPITGSFVKIYTIDESNMEISIIKFIYVNLRILNYS